MRAILALVLGILFINIASASILCDTVQVIKNWNKGDAVNSASITCTETENITSSVTTLGNHFSTTPSIPFSINPGQQLITINFNSNTDGGYYEEALVLGSSKIIPIKMNVTQTQTQSNSCQINPSLISYSQTIQQGTQVPIPKITFDPINCNGPLILTASSVSIQGGIITTSGQKPLSISSVQQDGINLNIDTTGLTTQQTYFSTLNINAFSKQFQIPFTITVTAGTTPIVNFSTTSLPTCSVTGSNLALNTTYSLVCTGIQPDIKIVPRVDNDFIYGVGLDTSANQYSWNFKPKKFGNTIIQAEFYYRDAPVGDIFKQEVKITSSGSSIEGTDLALLFTPSLDIAKEGDSVIVQIIDNKTNNLVATPQLYLNAAPQSINGSIFNLRLFSNIDYQIRAVSPGYNDLVSTVKLLTQPMNINITPSTGDSQTTFKIIAVDNASLFIDGLKVDNPYNGLLAEGNRNIRAIKQGYNDANLNFTVDKALTLIPLSEFKSGTNQVFTLSKNSSWSVNYQKDLTSEETTIKSGTSDSVEFTPEDKGIYKVLSGDKVIGTYEIKGWDGKFLGLGWFWYAGVIIVIVVLISLKSTSPAEHGVNLWSPTNA